MNFKFKFGRPRTPKKASSLADLHPGQRAVLGRLKLPQETADHLMRLGFLPGSVVRLAGAGPGGDPRVFHVDGSQVALRRETARHISINLLPEESPVAGD